MTRLKANPKRRGRATKTPFAFRTTGQIACQTMAAEGKRKKAENNQKIVVNSK